MVSRASDIMSKNITVIREEESIREAAERLASENVGALPITDRNQVIKGMLTDRDIVVQVVARGRDVNSTTARELEQGEVVSLRPDDSLDHARDLMAQHQVRRLPVVEEGRVVGMVSQADIAKGTGAESTGRMVSEISKG